MPKEISVGAIVFRYDKEIKYLFLKYEAGHWDFPRGGVEKGESEKDTAKREIFEETGIVDIEFIDGFREKTFWFYKKEGKTFYKEAIFYLAKTNSEKVKLSSEHVAFKWLSLDEILEQATFSNTKKILQKAHDFLQENQAL
jgi:8-oxo-dGTP pyrophosphatase MutT (NUDIX family)